MLNDYSDCLLDYVWTYDAFYVTPKLSARSFDKDAPNAGHCSTLEKTLWTEPLSCWWTFGQNVLIPETKNVLAGFKICRESETSRGGSGQQENVVMKLGWICLSTQNVAPRLDLSRI